MKQYKVQLEHIKVLNHLYKVVQLDDSKKLCRDLMYAKEYYSEVERWQLNKLREIHITYLKEQFKKEINSTNSHNIQSPGVYTRSDIFNHISTSVKATHNSVHIKL